MIISLIRDFYLKYQKLIDPHKMTNLEMISKLNKSDSVLTSFYIKILEKSLYDLKKCAIQWN